MKTRQEIERRLADIKKAAELLKKKIVVKPFDDFTHAETQSLLLIQKQMLEWVLSDKPDPENR